jgi:hypothetical protein
VIVPLTAGRDSGASGPGEMGQGSLPTSNGITPRWGTRFLPPIRPLQDHQETTSCAPQVALPVVFDATLAKMSSRTLMVALSRWIS